MWKIRTMKRLHVIGRKNSGKTTLVVDLVKEFSRRGINIGTIKHTHHRHELDVPGKDSYQHRAAGASVVGILSPTMNAIFMPTPDASALNADRYDSFAPMFAQCQLVLVEGDSLTTAPKIEVWREDLGAQPLAAGDPAIQAVITDDKLSVAQEVLPRANIELLSNWIISKVLDQPMLCC
jgi:molybdopterin-guanine dinucleotide biosynthesis protein MobB